MLPAACRPELVRAASEHRTVAQPKVAKRSEPAPGRLRQHAPASPPPSPAAPDARSPRGATPWLVAFAISACTWIAFQPALAGGWLDWDDVPLLIEQQRWRGLAFENVRWMFTTFHMGPYQPLSWLSYALDHELGGLDPRHYHATNNLLHAAAAACLYLVARELFALGRRAVEPLAGPSWWTEVAAAFAALSWAAHPLRVESVAWITERRDVLSGLFFLLSLRSWLAHARAVDPGRARRARRWALAFFAASLLAKGLGLVLPFLLLVLDVWPLRRLGDEAGSRGSRLLALAREKWPFFALSLAAAVLAVIGQRATGALVGIERLGIGDRCAQAAYGLVFYVQKTVWPSDLMVLHPITVPFDAGAPRFVAAGAVLVVAGIALWTTRRRLPAIAAAFAAYAITVAPVLGLIQAGSQLVASRYSYLGTIPLALLAGGGVLAVARRLSGARGGIALAAACAALVPLALATRAQCAVWHDSMSLWEHDLAIDPSSAPARRSLIAAWLDRGRAATEPALRRASLERALAECRAGTAIAPDPMYWVDAAKAHDLMALDDPDGARALWETAADESRGAVELMERTGRLIPEVYETAGVLACKLERPAEAVPYFEKLAAASPGKVAPLGMLAEALIQAARPREALAPLAEARRLEPESKSVWLALGDAHRASGERAEALAAYRRVVDLALGDARDPDLAAARAAIDELSHAR